MNIKEEFGQQIVSPTRTFVNRAHELCGTDDSDLR